MSLPSPMPWESSIGTASASACPHPCGSASNRARAAPSPKRPSRTIRYSARVRNTMVGSNRLALAAAAPRACAGLPDAGALERDPGRGPRDRPHARRHRLRNGAHRARPMKPPACIITGGETTVTLRGDGFGGRAQEFALAAALDIAGLDKCRRAQRRHGRQRRPHRRRRRHRRRRYAAAQSRRPPLSRSQRFVPLFSSRSTTW
jgi:hypothetical protein